MLAHARADLFTCFPVNINIHIYIRLLQAQEK